MKRLVYLLIWLSAIVILTTSCAGYKPSEQQNEYYQRQRDIKKDIYFHNKQIKNEKIYYYYG